MGLVRLRRGVEHCVASFEVPNVVAPSLESVIQAEEVPNLVHCGVPEVIRIRVPARKRGVQQEHAVIDVPFVDLVRPMRDPPEHTAVGLASIHVEVSLGLSASARLMTRSPPPERNLRGKTTPATRHRL